MPSNAIDPEASLILSGQNRLQPSGSIKARPMSLSGFLSRKKPSTAYPDGQGELVYHGVDRKQHRRSATQVLGFKTAARLTRASNFKVTVPLTSVPEVLPEPDHSKKRNWSSIFKRPTLSQGSKSSNPHSLSNRSDSSRFRNPSRERKKPSQPTGSDRDPDFNPAPLQTSKITSSQALRSLHSIQSLFHRSGRSQSQATTAADLLECSSDDSSSLTPSQGSRVLSKLISSNKRSSDETDSQIQGDESGHITSAENSGDERAMAPAAEGFPHSDTGLTLRAMQLQDEIRKKASRSSFKQPRPLSHRLSRTSFLLSLSTMDSEVQSLEQLEVGARGSPSPKKAKIEEVRLRKSISCLSYLSADSSHAYDSGRDSRQNDGDVSNGDFTDLDLGDKDRAPPSSSCGHQPFFASEIATASRSIQANLALLAADQNDSSMHRSISRRSLVTESDLSGDADISRQSSLPPAFEPPASLPTPTETHCTGTAEERSFCSLRTPVTMESECDSNSDHRSPQPVSTPSLASESGSDGASGSSSDTALSSPEIGTLSELDEAAANRSIRVSENGEVEIDGVEEWGACPSGLMLDLRGDGQSTILFEDAVRTFATKTARSQDRLKGFCEEVPHRSEIPQVNITAMRVEVPPQLQEVESILIASKQEKSKRKVIVASPQRPAAPKEEGQPSTPVRPPKSERRKSTPYPTPDARPSSGEATSPTRFRGVVSTPARFSPLAFAGKGQSEDTCESPEWIRDSPSAVFFPHVHGESEEVKLDVQRSISSPMVPTGSIAAARSHDPAVRAKLSLADFLSELNAPIDPNSPPKRPKAHHAQRSSKLRFEDGVASASLQWVTSGAGGVYRSQNIGRPGLESPPQPRRKGSFTQQRSGRSSLSGDRSVRSRTTSNASSVADGGVGTFLLSRGFRCAPPSPLKDDIGPSNDELATGKKNPSDSSFCTLGFGFETTSLPCQKHSGESEDKAGMSNYDSQDSLELHEWNAFRLERIGASMGNKHLLHQSPRGFASVEATDAEIEEVEAQLQTSLGLLDFQDQKARAQIGRKACHQDCQDGCIQQPDFFSQSTEDTFSPSPNRGGRAATIHRTGTALSLPSTVDEVDTDANTTELVAPSDLDSSTSTKLRMLEEAGFSIEDGYQPYHCLDEPRQSAIDAQTFSTPPAPTLEAAGLLTRKRISELSLENLVDSLGTGPTYGGPGLFEHAEEDDESITISRTHSASLLSCSVSHIMAIVDQRLDLNLPTTNGEKSICSDRGDFGKQPASKEDDNETRSEQDSDEEMVETANLKQILKSNIKTAISPTSSSFLCSTRRRRIDPDRQVERSSGRRRSQQSDEARKRRKSKSRWLSSNESYEDAFHATSKRREEEEEEEEEEREIKAKQRDERQVKPSASRHGVEDDDNDDDGASHYEDNSSLVGEEDEEVEAVAAGFESYLEEGGVGGEESFSFDLCEHLLRKAKWAKWEKARLLMNPNPGGDPCKERNPE